MNLPSAEVLVSCEREPRLAVLSLPSGRIRPSRLECPRGIAAENILPVEDWVGLHNNSGLWGARLPAGGTMKPLAKTFRAIPDRARGAIWICPESDKSRAGLVDFRGRVLDELPLADGQMLEHVFGEHSLTFRLGDGHLFVRQRSGPVRPLGRAWMSAARGGHVLVRRSPDLPLFIKVNGEKILNPERAERFSYTLLDLVASVETNVPTPTDRICYASSGSVSADGRQVVFGARPRDKRSKGTSSLVIVDQRSGATRIIEDAGSGPSSVSIWSADDRWIFTPEFERGMRVTNAATGESTIVLAMRNQSFQPILDIASAPELASAERTH